MCELSNCSQSNSFFWELYYISSLLITPSATIILVFLSLQVSVFLFLIVFFSFYSSFPHVIFRSLLFSASFCPFLSYSISFYSIPFHFIYLFYFILRYVIGSCIKHIPLAGRTITQYIQQLMRERKEPIPAEVRTHTYTHIIYLSCTELSLTAPCILSYPTLYPILS